MLPLAILCRAASRASGRPETTFQGFSQLVGLWPGVAGNYLRRGFYRWTLDDCPRNCHIGFGTLFATPKVSIGNHVYIGPRCMIADSRIGDDVLIGTGVDILGGKRQHYFDRLDIPIRLQGGESRTIRIGRDVWLGNGSIIAEDVGEQAIVAAGAVVVKPVSPRTIVGGNPARVIGTRDDRS